MLTVPGLWVSLKPEWAGEEDGKIDINNGVTGVLSVRPWGNSLILEFQDPHLLDGEKQVYLLHYTYQTTKWDNQYVISGIDIH